MLAEEKWTSGIKRFDKDSVACWTIKRATFRGLKRARSGILSLRETSIEKIIDFSLSRKLIPYINDNSDVICTLSNVSSLLQ